MSKVERAKALFARNTEAKEVYATSDGYLFFDKTKAEAHAGTLSDRALETISREQTESHQAEAKDKAATDSNKAFYDLLMERTNAELKKLAAEYGLTTTGRENKKQLVELIAAHAQQQGANPELTELEIAQRKAAAQGKISDEDKAKVATAQ